MIFRHLPSLLSHVLLGLQAPRPGLQGGGPRLILPSSSTPVEGPSQTRPSRMPGPSRAPRAISEATRSLHPGLAHLRLPYSISYYTLDSTLAFREVSLENVDRLDLPPEDITEG
ncbi:hypothetical protein JCGZ_08909 [Jatropha curcas]|uniref:Uncharacterized protein n=1 Tax=Jatropha curcas TaxID=180498 RepID=A0A067KJV5_JATCU|nr:hypothetical protein JCGZ_08909 [Jatropha curcas]